MFFYSLSLEMIRRASHCHLLTGECACADVTHAPTHPPCQKMAARCSPKIREQYLFQDSVSRKTFFVLRILSPITGVVTV